MRPAPVSRRGGRLNRGGNTVHKVFSVIVAFAMLLAGPLAAQDSDRYGTQRVAYHINSPGGDENRYYFASMRNVQNHINAVGAGNLEVAVVMHGNGIGLVGNAVDDTQLQTVISSLKGQGVRFVVCANTLSGRNIDWENDLYDVWEEDIVPSGVAELSHLQAQGYTYIHP
jgi:intracellular sulfur oxidation DsrE/DsrF family protein